MMILYLFLLLTLVLARLFVVRRAARLEKKFIRAAQAARDLLAQPVWKPGNSNRTDACAHAKHQYLLGEVTAQRDRAELRYLAWQNRADKLARVAARIRAWKGRKVPYLAGVFDAALLLMALSLLGVLDVPALHRAVEELTARLGG